MEDTWTGIWPWSASSRGRTGGPSLRIGRLDGDRVIEDETPVLFSRMDALGVARDTVIALASHRFRGDAALFFYARAGETWEMKQELKLEPQCQAEAGEVNDAVFGHDVLVVTTRSSIRDVWCIYERHGASFRYATVIRRNRDRIRALGLSRDRFVVLTSNAVDVFQRVNGHWDERRLIKAPAGVRFTSLALSDRWFVTRGAGVLYVYELDTARLVATLSPQFEGDTEFATWFAVSDTRIAATGTIDQVWGFSGDAWHPLGALTGADSKSDPISRHVQIGDVIWIGNPRMRTGPDGGSIHGFRR
jgi:hypothetical protein